jgi:ABC-type glycerol-3-phosphate transport system substrate-binding protein
MMALSVVIAGCSSNTKEPQATPKADATGQTQTPQATETKKENLQLRWFIPGKASSTLPKDDFVKKTIEEKFNVTLNVEYMAAGTDYDNKISVMLAGGEAPDLFIASGTASQKYANDGLLADMTPFVNAKTMPNYFKYWFKEADLPGYAVTKGTFWRAPLPFPNKVYRSYYVRKDWLDKLGLKVPNTYDEMIDVMRKFTFDDPDGNGKKDTYGMSASGNANSLSYDFPDWLKQGLLGGSMLVGDTYSDTQSDPKIQFVIDGVVKHIAEGIIDPDWFLNKGVQHLDKAAQGKVGIILSDEKFALESIATSYQNKTKSITPQANWVPFQPYKDTGVWTENIPGYPFLFSAVTAQKQPAKIVRSVEILDWLSSPEGYLLTHYGKEGVHYTKNGSTYTLNKAAIKKDIVDQGDFLSIWDFFTRLDEPERVGLTIIDPDVSDRDRDIIKTVKAYKHAPSIGVSTAPPAGINIGDFRTKMREYHVKLLFDEKSGANWPKYRAELMEKYQGKAIFEEYAKQISAVQGRTVKFQ